MKAVGIFEAKTHFPNLCKEVATTGRPVLVRKRGTPLVIISPAGAELSQDRPDILTAWKQWKATEGAADPEFPEVWRMRDGSKSSPLED